MEPVINEANNNPLNIPPKLPQILKQFCKAAIKTQPYDLLIWSKAYFHALAQGTEPPTKFRLEYPLFGGITDRLTFGFVKVLHRQFSDYNKVLPVETIVRHWDNLCLSRKDLNLIMIIGKFRRKCQVKKFLALAIGLLNSSLFDTMVMICELFTMDPDGGAALIPVNLFIDIYTYLAGRRCDGERLKSNEDPSQFVIQTISEAITPELSEESNKINSSTTSNKMSETDTNGESDNELPYDVDYKKFSCNSTVTHTDRVSITPRDEIQVIHEDLIEQLEAKNSTLIDQEDNFIKLPKIPTHNDEKIIDSDDVIEISSEKKEMNGAKKKLIVNHHWLTHYPVVPGIGPQLTVDEIAVVTEWMNEWAEIQDGMVGPRNLRHFQCPPLDRQKKPKS